METLIAILHVLPNVSYITQQSTNITITTPTGLDVVTSSTTGNIASATVDTTYIINI